MKKKISYFIYLFMHYKERNTLVGLVFLSLEVSARYFVDHFISLLLLI